MKTIIETEDGKVTRAVAEVDGFRLVVHDGQAHVDIWEAILGDSGDSGDTEEDHWSRLDGVDLNTLIALVDFARVSAGDT